MEVFRKQLRELICMVPVLYVFLVFMGLGVLQNIVGFWAGCIILLISSVMAYEYSIKWIRDNVAEIHNNEETSIVIDDFEINNEKMMRILITLGFMSLQFIVMGVF